MPNVSVTLADHRLVSLDAGRFYYDGGAMFGAVPKVIWETLVPVDERNRICLTLSPLLIVSGARRILVDVGFGGPHVKKDARLYGFDAARNVATALRDEGLSPEDIDTVVLTHLHSDHAAGSVACGQEGPEPAFRNARYIVNEDEWGAALDPDPRSAAAYREDDFRPIERAGRLDLVGDGCDIGGGVSLLRTGGHTVGHMAVLVDTPAGTAFYPADLIPSRHHVRTPYTAGVDLFPLDLMREKQALLARALAEEWLVILDHDADGNVGRIVEDEKRRFAFRDVDPRRPR